MGAISLQTTEHRSTKVRFVHTTINVRGEATKHGHRRSSQVEQIPVICFLNRSELQLNTGRPGEL